MSEFETWVNTSKASYVLGVHHENGSRSELVVPGGKRFTFNSKDRERNADFVIKADYDPFQNGAFVPVTDVVSDKKDVDEVNVQNPHHLTDTQLAELLSGNGNTFKSQLNRMTAEPVLQRLLDVAQSDVDVAPRRVAMINERLEELGFPVTSKSRTVDKVRE